MTNTLDTIGVILAAGEGTRLAHQTHNKTALAIEGKALVEYGVELFQSVCQEILVVVGAKSESVRAVLQNYPVHFAEQTERRGTGHAAQVAIQEVQKLGWEPKHVLIGYGDHMMFYTPEVLRDLIAYHEEKQAAITLISTHHENPNELAWGRIVRDQNDDVLAIVEQKDATEEQRAITELNAGLYCCDYQFLAEVLPLLQPSPITNELYLTECISLAQQRGRRVAAYAIPYEFVGVGINTAEQMVEAEQLLKQAE